MDDYFEGWKYINAVFTLFEEKAKCRIKDSHIVPRHIFRGITKRFFTESTILNKMICDYTPTNTIDASLNWIFGNCPTEPIFVSLK